MQNGPVRRTLALALALCVWVVGLAALRHETAVAHVRDALTGAVAHAHALAERHEQHSTTPHLHGRDVAADHESGECVLLAALDHATILPTLPSGAEVATAADLDLVPALALAPTAQTLYLLAPKTSPPARA